MTISYPKTDTGYGVMSKQAQTKQKTSMKHKQAISIKLNVRQAEQKHQLALFPELFWLDFMTATDAAV